MATVTIPFSQDRTWWAHDYFNIEQYWGNYTGSNVVVAIVDTGINDSTDFPNETIVARHNVLTNNENVNDVDGHGSTCAGIIAGRGFNLITGVAPETQLIIVKCANRQGEITLENVIRSLEWLVNYCNEFPDRKPDILSISISFGQNDQAFVLLRRIYEMGITIVGSIGGRSIGLKAPGLYNEVIGVGACHYNIETMQWSYYPYAGCDRKNDHLISCTAPGVGTPSYFNNEAEGVSFSTAFVAGVIALALSKFKFETIDRTLSPVRIKHLIEETALPICGTQPEEYHPQMGKGLINVAAIMDQICD